MCLPRPCCTLPTWPLLEVKAGPKAIKSSPPCYGIDMPSFTNVCGWGPWIHTLYRRGREQSLCKETFETAPWGPNSKLYQKKEGNQQEVCGLHIRDSCDFRVPVPGGTDSVEGDEMYWDRTKGCLCLHSMA